MPVFTADTRKRGAASGNTVNIQSGTIGGSEESTLSGGYSEDGASDDNTVTITGGILSSLLSLYGGYSTTASSGNTLNLYTKGNTIENLGYFQTLNFYVPAGTSAGETMLEVTGTADVSNAVIRAGVEDTTKLNPGEVINLIHDANNPIVTDGTTYSMMSGKDTAMDAGFLERKVLIKKQDANTIVLYVPEDSTPALNPDTKLIPESREAAVGALKNAADLISKDAYDAASAAWEDHNVKDHFVPYAVIGGHNLRYETGSYVDANGLAANVGFVRRIDHKGHTDTVMPFLEYGRSNYTSHLDDGARGDGREHYTGAGLLLRRDLADGLYYEGALRAGYTKGDFHGIIAGAMTRYESGSPYLAAQAGLGKIYTKDRDTYDVYGKFFYTHLGSDSATLKSSFGSSKYDFGDVDSYVTRLGMRWTRNFDTVRAFYAGIGWDYEFGGKASAYYQTYRTESPSMKGGSGFLELGWESKIDDTHPWGVDLRATGWAGKQRGATYYAAVSHKF
ncbi:autotransporter domain-containing protein [Dialister hominis]|uniref:autotransporter domain-containing protein n=1 Tax=Dialister hominis TaxID=2582419 RepID=UPI003522CCCB